MKYVADIALAIAASGFVGWLLRLYIDKRLSAHFARIEKLQAITLEITKNRINQAFESLNALQVAATVTRNGLRRLSNDFSPTSAENLCRKFDDFESALYSRQTYLEPEIWRLLHVYKKAFEPITLRISAITAEVYCANSDHRAQCATSLKSIERKHHNIRKAIHAEIRRLEDDRQL